MKITTNYLIKKFIEIQQVAIEDPQTAIVMGQVLLSDIDNLGDNLPINIISLRY